jgi:acyl phosphate:glycerol-3-phosphate acyltransferase
MLINLLLIVFAYLLGSLSAAIIVCKLFGLEDPRTVGSKNPGATNVLRMHGKKAGVVALLGDLIKGIIPVLAARYAGAPEWVIALSGLTVFLGHLYPLYFRFGGGKGVATMLGVLLATSWLLGLLFIVTWLAIAILFRYSSVAGMTVALLSPIYAAWLTPGLNYVVCISVMGLLVVVRHRQNIRNLIAGTESRFGDPR